MVLEQTKKIKKKQKKQNIENNFVTFENIKFVKISQRSHLKTRVCLNIYKL